MSFEINDNVPIPIRKPKSLKWPFNRMEIGQSIKVDYDQHWLSACRAAQSVGRRKGWKFQVSWNKTAKNEKTHEREPYGTIWRVE